VPIVSFSTCIPSVTTNQRVPHFDAINCQRGLPLPEPFKGAILASKPPGT
jgi:hypothetical protein